VPVRNDAVRLATCLGSIRRNNYPSAQFEIIVIDNGSTDGSAEVATRFGGRVVTIARARVSELRNLGARHATGEVLAFVDADNEIAAGWIHSAIEILRMPGVGAAGALYHAPANGTWVQRAYGRLRGEADGQHDTSWVGSGNLAVWRHIFEAADGFDTSLEACEDVNLCRRIRANGLRIVSDARLRSVHHGDPQTLADLFRSELWRGRDNLRVSFRPPVVWAELPSAIVPIVDAALVATALLGIIGIFAGWPRGLLVTSAAALALTATAWLKVIKAATRKRGTWSQGRCAALLQMFVVACVYDLGRALALVVRVPHRGSRPRAVPAAL
jgi:glycosyltransferase involved in cell wall biosynthesis